MVIFIHSRARGTRWRINSAIAINRGALLFTFNVRHFEGLEEMGLKMFPATET